jgi:hypothetical protein
MYFRRGLLYDHPTRSVVSLHARGHAKRGANRREDGDYGL